MYVFIYSLHVLKDNAILSERDRKNMGRRDDDRIEKLPEWAADGPTSVNDLIELKGFDEPKSELCILCLCSVSSAFKLGCLNEIALFCL